MILWLPNLPKMHFNNIKNDNLIINSFNLQRIVKLKKIQILVSTMQGFNICSYKQYWNMNFVLAAEEIENLHFKKPLIRFSWTFSAPKQNNHSKGNKLWPKKW